MPTRPTTFPIAEGVGIFFGIVAWNILSEGRMEILKALAITIPCTLVWFALRSLKNKYLNHDH